VNSKRRVQTFVKRQLLGDMDAKGDALAEGLLDSLAIEELIGFLEDSFSIEFEDDELDAQNFSSIDAVVALVDRKRRSRR
jgi:acyl carrier protein